MAIFCPGPSLLGSSLTQAHSAPPILCLYDAGAREAAPDAVPEGLPASTEVFRFTAPHPHPARAALLACAAAHPGRDIVLLDRGTRLPEGAWRRLCAAQALEFDVVSPLSPGLAALDPFAETRRPATTDEADACVWMLSEREAIPCAQWLAACALWKSTALDALAAAGADGELPPGLQAAALDSLYVDGAPARGATAPAPPAIAVLRERIAALGGRIPSSAGRDLRPVLLHLLHGWGGGVQRFVTDLMRASRQYRHLALVAHGSSERHTPGEALALYDDLDAAPLARWPLALGIGATALASGEYRAALDRVLARYGVGQILVSSLIGHGLAALRTNLPTAVICHDYYPLWPILHADFGDAKADFSPGAMDDALARAGTDLQFSETRPAAWHRLREDYVAALRDARIPLLCPSRTVHDNLARIEPRLGTLPWRLIPHGMAPWDEPIEAVTPPAREGLRVLVLGRINGGKGEDLLADLLPRCDRRIEFLLLGAGRAGMRFFGTGGVHLRMDYRREELPGLIRRFAPDLALIPATVAETFSYTLSELWSLGVPVLATRIGSLAERIEHGADGLLVEPSPEAVAAALAGLLQDRMRLIDLRTVRPPRTLRDMAADYEAVLPRQPPAQAHPTAKPDPTRSAELGALRAEHSRARAALSGARSRLVELQRDIEERTQWADGLQAQLDARTRWAHSLQSSLEDERRHIDRLREELAQRTVWAQSLESNLDTARGDLAALRTEFEDRTRWALALKDQLDMTENELSQLQTLNQQMQTQTDSDRRELEERREEIAQLRTALLSAMAHGETMQRDRDAILASRSWRMTRPLRYAFRLAGTTLTRLKFRLRRLANLWSRTRISLRSRGPRGTWHRIRQELRPAPQVTPMSLPETGSSVEVGDIALPASDAPAVSIVIPVYNHLDATLVCLRSLAQTKNATPHEILVVDDCSSDESSTVLPKVAGLRYQRNERNLGFIGACNAGAANARGEYVLFLNNDTAVQDGWIDALIGTFGEHRDVGLVGAKLVYPDGRLQEAGGIVFSDGSGWNYGRFDDPAKPEYNFVREVDYCSGAAITLRTELFRRFGGFDAHYAPAYYEDTDLAMKVRQAGLRVLYQPDSVVVHFEGISSGTDTASGTKRYQVVNKEKFFERWKDALASHPDPTRTAPQDIVRARQHRDRKQVLVIDATTPQPDHDSGSVRLCNILRLLREDGHAVTFFADNRAWVERYTGNLQQMGVEVLWHPHLSDPVRWFEENGRRLDLVFVSRHYIASSYVDLVRRHAPRATLAFDTVDLHYLREQRAAELAGSDEMARAAEKTREQELRLIRDCDVTLVVSPVEQALLAKEAPGARVEVLSNVHEIFGRRRGFSERSGLMFIGGYQHPPNVDAAIWFAREILPRVRAELPDLVFHLIGSKAPAEVKALGDLPGVEFHGFVEDIEPFLDGCRLAVAPLRYGAGVKGKVNMSMSYGQPVVATGIAVEGMYAEPGRDVLVAETPEDFAAQVLRAYRDEALWTQLSDHGLANVERHFSFDSALTSLRRLLGEAR